MARLWTSRRARRAGFALLAGVLVSLPPLAAHTVTHAAGGADGQVAAWVRAWPMVGHDPQRTNRSPSSGPLHPRLVFTAPHIAGPPLIGPDGTMYSWAYNQSTYRGGLTSLTATGRQRWTVPLSRIEGGPPALLPGGMVVVNGRDGSGHEVIAAVAATGQRSWTIRSLPWTTGLRETPHSKEEAPLATSTNLLYMPFVGPEFKQGENVGVQVLSSTGTPLGVVLPGILPDYIAGARDGTFYELGHRCCTGPDSLSALNTTGVRRWTRVMGGEEVSGLLVGTRGTIYVSAGTGYSSGQASAVTAYTPAGQRLWRLRVDDGWATLAERADGTVLVASATGLSAVSPGGALIWHRTLWQPTRATAATLKLPSLAVDAVGRVYIGGSDGVIRAVGPNGAVLWTRHAGGFSNGVTPTVALGPDGTLAIAGTDGRLRVYR